MGMYKEELVEAKDARRGVKPQRERPNKSKAKRNKPFLVEIFRFWSNPGWNKWGAYKTRTAAEQSIARKERDSFFGKYYKFRIREIQTDE